MSNKRKPKVIILENNAKACHHAESILLDQGWDVICETSSKEALNCLASSKKTLFALFISNFKLPKMEGDDILSKVKSISPLTQRMLMVPGDRSQTLIKAINKAKINACIISPFEDEDLVNQAKNCLRQFKHALKRAQLKRVTRHQNKQMYTIAKKLKKKSNAYQKIIEEKNTRKGMLSAKKRKLKKQAMLDADITLEKLLEHRQINPSPDVYQKEFAALCQEVKRLFDQLTTKHKTDPVELDFSKILNTTSKPDKEGEQKADPSQLPEQETLDLPPDDKTDEVEETDSRNTEDETQKDNTAARKDQTPEDEATHQEDDDRQEGEPPAPEPDYTAVINQILKTTFTGTLTGKVSDTPPPTESDKSELDDLVHTLDDYFEITISDDQTQAFIKKKKPVEDDMPPTTVSDILDLLMQNQISYGLLEDDAIEAWLSKSKESKITIAQGEAPIKGQDGSIQFHFPTDYTNPGKINEDGSIDFRERGDIPQVSKTAFLAQKTPPEEGRAGITISGTPIPIEEVIDPAFSAGSGVELSEDGTKIHATIDGQPHLDKMGTISVSPELVIPADVDYETGNIDFKGNIIIKGMIKEGFTVRGINLTVKEIEGGTIDLTGDLNVSDGITDSNISVHGNTQAKFINNSNLMGFGDLTVSKEILDSNILLSGCCFNTGGHIISSSISSKLGVDAANIGTSSSEPVKLKVGVEEHIKTLNKKIDDSLEISVNKANALKAEIKKLEEQDQNLYEQISEKAHVQDRSQVEISQIKSAMPEIEKSNDLSQLAQMTNKIKALNKKANIAEKELNTIFKAQDKIANSIESLKTQIDHHEKKSKTLVLEKKALKEFSIKNQAKPFVAVSKNIIQNTIIKGPHSSIILKEDQSRCKIQELTSEENGIIIHEMLITDL